MPCGLPPRASAGNSLNLPPGSLKQLPESCQWEKRGYLSPGLPNGDCHMKNLWRQALPGIAAIPSLQTATGEPCGMNLCTPVWPPPKAAGAKTMPLTPRLRRLRWMSKPVKSASCARSRRMLISRRAVFAEIRILRAVTAHDCGFPINPLLVEGQIDGQVSMALGHALFEEVMMQEGRTVNPSWLDYRMPTIHNLAPSEHIDVITEAYKNEAAFRSKEVGEGYVSAILSAIENAIYDATGVRLKSTPFTPEKILKGLAKVKRSEQLIVTGDC